MSIVESIESNRVISVQSHVSYGYVGGKAAVFPLQCLGYDVDVVHTVNFSNHVGYGRFGGSKTSATELTNIFGQLEKNGLLTANRILTGYIAGAESLIAVADAIKKLRTSRPDTIYLLDPVLGDAGRLYVAADTIPVYKSLLPYSTVITPNWFEVETLTNVPLTSLESLRKALQILHQDYRVPNIAISSLPLQGWLWDVLPKPVQPPSIEDVPYLVCITSSSNMTDNSLTSTVYVHAFEQISGYFTGVGDLFSALLLAHYHPSHEPEQLSGILQTPLSYAASLATTKTRAVLSLTHEYALKLPEEDRQPSDAEADAADPNRKVRRMRGRELRVIQGQDIIRGVAPGVKVERLQPWADFWSE